MSLTFKEYLHRIGSSTRAPVIYGVSFIVGTIILSSTAIQSDSKATVAQAQAVSISTSLSQLCHAGNDLAALLQTSRTVDGKPLCPTAEAIQANPTAVAAPIVTDAHIVSLIRAELDKNPVSGSTGPTLPQVIEAVRVVMNENRVLFKGDKGDPGDAANTAEIAQVVAAYFRANAEQFRGPAGKNGVDGKNGADGKDGRDGNDGQDGSNGSNGSDSPPATVTETAQPDPPRDTDPDPATDSPTTTQQEQTQSRQRQQQQRGGGLGGLLGGH